MTLLIITRISGTIFLTTKEFTSTKALFSPLKSEKTSTSSILKSWNITTIFIEDNSSFSPPLSTNFSRSSTRPDGWTDDTKFLGSQSESSPLWHPGEVKISERSPYEITVLTNAHRFGSALGASSAGALADQAKAVLGQTLQALERVSQDDFSALSKYVAKLNTAHNTRF